MEPAAVPTNPGGREADARIGTDESAIILLRHCHDVKRQETRFRLVTLLLLISCATLVIFTFYYRGSAGRWRADEQSPVYSKLETRCPAGVPETNPGRMHIDLRFLPKENTANRQLVNWEVMLGGEYSTDKSAIVIHQKGIYFVYVRFHIGCQSLDYQYEPFFVELQKWTRKYPMDVVLMNNKDGITCAPSDTSMGQSRTVFMGGLFELMEGDHVKVYTKEGYKLIQKSSFGAFLT